MNTPPNHEFKSEQYDDPNRDFVCGASADGLPCPLGPSHRGECRAVCTPRREGDRYYCNNASEFAGACDEGPLPDGECCQMPPQCTPTQNKQSRQWFCNRGKCQEGPLPDGTCNLKFGACRPVRSVLARRRIAVYIGLGLAIGSLLILTALPQRQAAVSPGNLASHHQTANGCKDCHTVGEGNLVDWVHAAFAAGADSGQSELCLKCHAELGQHAQYAHSQAPQSLAVRTESFDQNQSARSEPLMLALARRGRPTAEQKLACATCHEEHRGRDFDMTQMGDLQCQVCHIQTFKSFGQGHPEFASYPYTRRTQIHFNHQTHYQIHFANFERTSHLGTAPTDEQGRFSTSSTTCAHCHVPDGAGNTMQLRGFEHSCGGCHSEQMSDLPLDIVRIPVDLFDSATTNVGPGDTILDFDRAAWIEKRETGIMRLLLASNSEIRDARDSLINWREKEGTAGLANAVQQYAAGMRELVADLLDADPTNLAERLRNIELAETNQENWHLLASTLLPDLSGVDRQRLLELLAEEKTSVDEASDDEVNGDPLEDADRLSTSEQRIGRSSPRWSLQADGDAWTLAYHPQGHGDVLLKRWLETAATHSTATSATAYARGESVSPWEQVFAELSGLAAPGRCMKCHTANENADDGLRIAWAARRSSMGVRGFTDFVHGPHLAPQQNVNCTSCHQLIEPVDDKVVLFQPEFIHRENTVNTNPHAVETSGFEPLQKSNCAECHQHTMAGDNCLTCHNYHVNSLDHVISASREPSVTK